MSDYTWRLADIVAKPSPPRFKMSAAMYEPPLGNARGLRNQPHLFGLFGVKDFLGGDPVSDVWIFTQIANTNEAEDRNRGEVANSSQRWLMERTGTTWPFSHRPRQPAETVGPGITGVVVS